MKHKVASRHAAVGLRRARGFVLAVTLWLLAGIAVVVGVMTLWSIDRVRDANANRTGVEDRVAMASTRDTLIYIAATRELTVAGLPLKPIDPADRAKRQLDEFGALRHDPVGGELHLDGTPYAGLDGTAFAIQDEAGLFSLTWPNPFQLDMFLVAQGAERDQAPRLRDALLDYIDADDLARLNGAESRDYRVGKREPPPNRRFLLPIEALRAYEWWRLPAEMQRRIPELTTTFESGAINLNTAPAALLPTWISGCPANCEALIARRARAPYRSSYELQTELGIRLPGDDLTDYRFMASESMRFTLWGRSGEAWRIHVRLTPLADQRAPWAVLAAYPTQRPTPQALQPIEDPLFTDAKTDRP